MGDTIDTILERQEEAACEEERNRRLEESYIQARRLHRGRKWQAVRDVFEQIHAEDPDYPDPEELLASSSDALELEQRVASLYDRGQRHMKAEEWQEAPLQAIRHEIARTAACRPHLCCQRLPVAGGRWPFKAWC
jgi:hypothetical protein